MFPNTKVFSLKSMLSITAKLKMFSLLNRRFNGSAFFIRVCSSLRSCLLVCPVIEHLTKRSCNDDINFVRLHKDASTLGSHKSKYGNAKLTDINKERSFCIFLDQRFAF